MNARAAVGLVAGREVRQRMRGRSFLATTVVIVVAILAIGVIHRAVAGGDDVETVTVGVVGDAPDGLAAAVAGLAPVVDLRIELEPVAAGTAREALEDGDVDAVLDAGDGTVRYLEEEHEPLQAVLAQSWAVAGVRAALDEAGVPAAQIDEALAPDPLRAELVDADETDDDTVAAIVGMMAGILLFGALQTYGSFILMGVVEEKSTAVVEVLLARVRATHLLAGKVLGIGAVALLQFSIVVVAGVAALLISGATVPAGVWAAVPWTAIWFVGGFALYSFLYAMAGVLVTRQEDAQSAAMPVSLVLVGGYVSVFFLLGDPDGGFARVLSLVPLFSPLLMPLRIAAGAPVLDVAVAFALLVGAVMLLARVAGRLYRRLVLNRGSRVRWLQALRAAS